MRDVAAEARAVLAGEHRVDEVVCGGHLVELVERDSRLDDRDVILGVDLEDMVHALEGHDDRVGPRDTRAREAGAGAAGRDGHAQLVGESQDRGHLRRRSGPDDTRRPFGRDGECLVVGVVLGDGVADEDLARFEDVREPLGQVTHRGTSGFGTSYPEPRTAILFSRWSRARRRAPDSRQTGECSLAQ